jgi:hypothetical protein
LAFCLSERCEERKAMLPVQSPAVSVSWYRNHTNSSPRSIT